MHVRHAVRKFAPVVGGLKDAAAQLAFHFSCDHHTDDSMVTLNRPFGEPDQHSPSIDENLGIPFRGSIHYPIAPSMVCELDSTDIVHIHGINFSAAFVASTKPGHRNPLFASTYGSLFPADFASKAKRNWFASITSAFALGYARIFGSNESDAATFGHIVPCRTIAIGVNTGKWHDSAARDLLPTLMFIDRFLGSKDMSALIQLVVILSPPWRPIIAGQHVDHNEGDLRIGVAATGVADQTAIHIEPDDVQLHALIGEAGYIVFASRYEGFGPGIFEGMSAGLVPLLRTIPPFRRLVERNGGLLVDLDDSVPAAEAMRVFHANDNAPKRCGSAIVMMQAFGWTDITALFAAEYRAVLVERSA